MIIGPSWRNLLKKGWEPLYQPEEISANPSKKTALFQAYPLPEGGPAVIVCPGGAYQIVADQIEGKPFAEAFNRAGFQAFVLNYRVGRRAVYPNPMEDLARMVCIVKSRLGNVPLVLCGSSAAGHLCAYFAAAHRQFTGVFAGEHYGLRPDAVLLAYPVISLLTDTHAVTRDTLLGKHADEDTLRSCSADCLVTPDYPPAFLWHCADDTAVPAGNSARMAAALEHSGVKHEFCLYSQGGHGIGLAEGTSADGWFEKAVLFIQSVL